MPLNPVRAHLLNAEDRLLAYPWSSFGWYLAAPEHRPGWRRVDRLLGEHGIQGDSAAGRWEFERHLEARRLEEADQETLKPLRRGGCLSETTLPVKWIAARVQIGTAKGAKTVLHHLAHGQHPRQTSSATKQCAQLEFQSTV